MQKMWNKHLGRSMQASIRNVFLLFIACQFISLVFFASNMISLVNREMFDYQQEVIKQVSSELDNLLDKVSMVERQLIWQVSTSHDSMGRANSSSLLEQRDLETQLRNMRRASSEIHEMYVMFSDGRVMSSSVTAYNKELLRAQWWLDEALLSAREHIIVSTHEAEYIGYPGDDVRAFSFVRKVRSLFDLRETAAIIQIDVDYTHLEEIIGNITIDASQSIYILDANDQVVCYADSGYIGMEAARLPGYAVGIGTKTGMYLLSNLIVINQPLSNANWHVVATLDMVAVLGELFGSILVFLIFPLLTIVMFLILSRTFSRRISAPLTEMVQHMQHLQAEHMTPMELQATSPEVMVLSRTYNEMLGRIERLMEYNQRKEHEAARAEYLMQMAQINPHFLYNTLETMRGLALEDGSERTAEIAKAIAAIFQYSTTQAEEVPLVRELEVIRSYMLIQNYRFEGRFDWFSHVAPRVQQARILRFSLQPIVENAILHGAKDRSHRAVLYIKAYQQGDRLTVEITDNGAGIPLEKLDEIRHSLVAKDMSAEEDLHISGIGIQNVHARIRYKYGPQYGLEIDSTPDGGTTVLLHFPLLL